MFRRSADSAFRRFQGTGDPAALARVFDQTAPELLRLARHLASSEAAAEDLLQATFVTAIESARDHDGARPVLPWLMGVLANHARAARRRSRRALDATGPRAPDGSDPVAAAEATELRASLARGIERLPEPYRPVLRLLLDHGLEPAEIARALERPQGTVRAQISRGLESLRRALPAGLTAGAALVATPGRGLAAVRASVLGRCGPEAGVPVAAATIGVLAFMTTKTILTVATLGGAAVLGFLLWPQPDLEPNAARAEPSAPSPGTDARAALDVRPAAAAGRELVEAAAPAPATTRASGTRTRALVVHVVRAADRTPLAGAQVRLQDVQTRELGDLGQTTDRNGDARFDEPPRGYVMVNVDRAGSVTSVTTPETGEARIEVAVPAGILVEGLVVDADGRPVPGAEILAHGVLLEPSAIARTDAAGRFTIVDAQPGLALDAQARGFGPSLAHPLQGRPGSRVELTLKLERAARQLTGRVLRANGAPSPGALVAAFDPRAPRPSNDEPRPRPRFTRAGPAGAFELTAPADRALLLVACPLTREADAPGSTALAAGSAAASADVFLRRPAALCGTVLKGGAQVPGGSQVIVWVEKPEDDFGFLLNMIGMRVVAPDADGSYRLAGLMPGDYQLSISSPGGASKDRRSLREGEEVRWDVDLAAGRTVRVRIDPPAPAATSGSSWWSVRLFRLVNEGGREFVGQQPMVVLDGRVEFHNLAAAEYEVVVGLAGFGSSRRNQTVAELGPITPGADEHVVRVRDDRLPTATLRGRLVDSQLHPRSNESVHAVTTVPRHPSWCTTTTGADGRFEFAAIVPGDWNVGLGEMSGPAITSVRQLAPGETRDLGDVRQP